MRKKLKKLLCVIIVIITIVNIFAINVSNATTTTVDSLDNAEEDTLLEKIGGGIGTFVDGVVGIISKVVQIPLLLIGMAIQGILTLIASLGGSSIEGFVTPDDVFFNRVGLTNINFFDLSGDSSSVIYVMRSNIATWYYILRILSVIILLVVLIYVGIRMAISTVASDQAKYKKMLFDWAASFALLFFLGYIIIFTLEANSALVAMFEQASEVTIGDGVVTELAYDVVTGGATKSWAALIVYFALIGMTTAFVIAYIKRMLTVGFLIIISPLITITYSIDKMKDGQAQALNTWMKEFMFNVLIQPFHVIIYLVFIGSVLDILATSPSLAKMLLAIICMSFIWTAEDIIKKIFGFKEASSLGETIAAMEIVRTLGNVGKKAASTGGKAVANTKFGKNIQQKVSGTPFNKAAHPVAAKVVDVGKTVVKKTGAVGVGAAAFGFELGANTPAKALQAGIAGYQIGNAYLDPKDRKATQQQLQSVEQDLKRYSNLLSKNNTLQYQNFQSNTTNRNALKNYANSLIGINMDMLNNAITSALAGLPTTAHTGLAGVPDVNYDINTAQGAQNLLALQNEALNENLDFNSQHKLIGTDGVEHSYDWTDDEKKVITAIQVRNFAQAVNSTHDQYKAAGSSDPKSDIDTYIDGL